MTEPKGLPLAAEEEEHTEEETSQPEDAGVKAAQAAMPLRVALPEATAGAAPAWVKLPPGFVFPRGKQIIFMRFKAIHTDTPWKGEPVPGPDGEGFEVDQNGKPVLYRQCVCWPINTADKKLALGRAQRDPNRAADELAKQMVRVHDGVEADWAVVRTNGVEMFWNELGEKCRGLLLRIFTQLHVLDTDGTRDFLQNCIEVRSTGS
jgi:hypothetical protein